MEHRRNRLKPILKEELKEFSYKVDKIVDYLTRKRYEERLDQNRNPFDPSPLKTMVYAQIV